MKKFSRMQPLFRGRSRKRNTSSSVLVVFDAGLLSTAKSMRPWFANNIVCADQVEEKGSLGPKFALGRIR